jgi:hypothetical protein
MLGKVKLRKKVCNFGVTTFIYHIHYRREVFVDVRARP